MRFDMATIALPLAHNVLVTATNAIARVSDTHRRRKLAGVLAAPSLLPLWSLSRQIRKLVDALRREPLDHLSSGDLRSLAHQLGQACGKLRKLISLYDDVGLLDGLVYKRFLVSISDGADRLESIVEGLYMGLDPEFCEILQGAAVELCGSPRRLVVGDLHD